MTLGGLAVAPLLAALQLPMGAIGGTVRDAGTIAPLSGATVAIPATGHLSTTDSTGHYLLTGVPPGPSRVYVRRIGYAPARFQALVAPGDTVEISVALAPEPVILPPLETHADLPGLVASPGEPLGSPDRALSAEAMRNHPLLAEPDALMALGGGEVVVRAESPTGLNVRGGTSDQVTHSLDGIPILNPFHLGGVFSALNPDALDRIELRGAALPSEAAEGLSGAVLATTRHPGERHRVQTGWSTTQLRGTLDGPLPGGAGYLLSLRATFPGLLGHSTDPTYLRGNGHDWLARFRVPALGGTAHLIGFGLANGVSASARASSQLVTGSDPPRNEFAWDSRSIGAGWNGARGLTAIHVRAWHAAGSATARWRARDSLPERLASRQRVAGLAVQLDRFGASHRSTAGVSTEWTTITYRLRPPAPGGRLLDREGRAAVVHPFLRHLQHLGPTTAVELTGTATLSGPGARFSPSLALHQRLGPGLTAGASVSRRHQLVQSLRNPESVVGHIFPVELPVLAGRAGIPIARGDEGGVEFGLEPSAALRLELRGYVRRSRGLVLVAPVQADPFATLGHTRGTGRAAGGSLALRWTGGVHEVVARYGLQRVRISYGDSTYLPAWGGQQRFDAALLLRPAGGTVVRLVLNAEWRARVTAIEDPFEWEACNLLDAGCEFAGSPHRRSAPLGSTRLPTYARTDLGIRQSFHIRTAGVVHLISVYGTATNIFSRRSLLTYVRDPVSGDLTAVTTRPRSPLVVGLEWSF